MTTKTIIAAIIAVTAPLSLAAAEGYAVVKTDGETLHISDGQAPLLTFVGGDAVFATADGATLFTIPASIISDISHIKEVATEYTVTYDGTSAHVVNPYLLQGVTTMIDGAHVATVSTNITDELTYRLTGTTTDGSFEFDGAFKCTLTLDNVSIKSSRGAALNNSCSKRIAVNVIGDNTFEDCAVGKQKACVYFKGHPEFTGDGKISITGNTSHGLSTKEYIQLKKKFGTLEILSAANDGIHAGQYFQINGGTVKVRGTIGDGIQAEATSKPEDEENGRMIIKGGTLDIEVTGDDSDCLKADSTITISGGKLLLRASGATSKGIKAKSCLEITDGDIDITVTGNGIVNETATQTMRAPGGGGWPGGGGGWPGGWPGGWDQEDIDTSSPGCIKVDSICTITAGTLTLKATGKGGKCLNVDNIAVIGAEGTDGPVITAATTGGVVTGSGENINGLPKAIKVYGNLDINSGVITATTTQNGGEGIECKSQLTINGGVVTCQTYDDGINSASKITINGGVVWASSSNNDGMDCNGQQGFEFNGGIILSSGSTQPEEGFDCDNYKFVINGGTIIGTGGATSTVTSATQPYASVSGKSITANTYLSLQKADGTVICSYLVPKTLSATVVVSSPEFTANTTYKLVTNSTAVTAPTESYLDGRLTIGGTLTGGTSSNITPKTR